MARLNYLVNQDHILLLNPPVSIQQVSFLFEHLKYKQQGAQAEMNVSLIF